MHSGSDSASEGDGVARPLRGGATFRCTGAARGGGALAAAGVAVLVLVLLAAWPLGGGRPRSARVAAAIHEVNVEDIPLSPWMGVRDRARLYALLANATYYREFGAGGSTVQAATFKNVKKILSSESDPQFVTELLSRHDLQHEVDDGRLFLQYQDIGPVIEWGRSKDNSKKDLWPAYSEYDGGLDVFRQPFWFDSVFVDGRFRAACVLKAIRATPADKISDTVFAVHDYVPRPEYSIIEQFAERFYIPESEIPNKWLEKSIEDDYKGIAAEDDILGLFWKKADCDEDALNEAISKVELDQA